MGSWGIAPYILNLGAGKSLNGEPYAFVTWPPETRHVASLAQEFGWNPEPVYTEHPLILPRMEPRFLGYFVYISVVLPTELYPTGFLLFPKILPIF
jgi:hypothetical protein